LIYLYSLPLEVIVANNLSTAVETGAKALINAGSRVILPQMRAQMYRAANAY